MHTSRRLLSLAALLVLAICVNVAGSAVAGGSPSQKVSAPTDLHGFLTRPDEPRSQEFPRTPSFAWNPVKGALCYEVELATSSSFTENSIVWSNVQYGVVDSRVKDCSAAATADSATASDSSDGSGTTSAPTPTSTESAGANPGTGGVEPLRVPAVAVDLALPWFTGQPYALHVRARAIGLAGAGPWSGTYSFNTRWPTVPTPLPSQQGTVRWTPVQGATGYEVWYQMPGGSSRFSTHTNIADLREYYTFFASSPQTVHWRVRAERRVFGAIPNGLPAVSYGPWSPVYTSTNPDPLARPDGPLKITMGISDRVSTSKKPSSHQLMPAITWKGDQGLDGLPYILFRVYGFTDRDCVNPVYTGPVVGGPAYAPRRVGLLKLPANTSEYRASTLPYGTDQGADTISADGIKVVSNEATGSAGSSTTSASGTTVSAAARVDLPDVDFPQTPYYFTVVPVTITPPGALQAAINVLRDGPPGGPFQSDAGGGAQSDSGAASKAEPTWVYRDVDLPQDACAAGRILALGKKSDPVAVSAGKAPNVTGLSTDGKLLSAKSRNPLFYSTPLVSWTPAVGATAYEVQWSKSRYPWKPVGLKQTFATATSLDLTPGQWYYRVRGLNQAQKAKPQMAWSAPVSVRVATPTFRVVASTTSPARARAARAAAATAKAVASIRAGIPAAKAFFADHGSYRGMTLFGLRKYDKNAKGFAVKAGSARSYCLQSTVGRLVNLTGPGATYRLGTCAKPGAKIQLAAQATRGSTSSGASLLRAAVPAIEAYGYDKGGYVGMTLAALRASYDGGIGAITIASATKTSYCIQAGDVHVKGPRGSVKPGPCS